MQLAAVYLLIELWVKMHCVGINIYTVVKMPQTIRICSIRKFNLANFASIYNSNGISTITVFQTFLSMLVHKAMAE